MQQTPSLNESFLPSVMNTSAHHKLTCLTLTPGSYILLTFYLTNIFFFIPVCILILLHAFQQRGSRGKTWSISDCFTYHLMTMELVGVLGYLLFCGAIYQPSIGLINAGTYLSSFLWNGEIYFHILLCVDRYLAVVHPIRYRSVKKVSKRRIRNVCVGCVWLMSFAEFGLLFLENHLIINSCILVVSLLVVSLCSLSILCALIHPAPGVHVGTRVFVDHSKRKAFYIVGTILAALILRFSWSLYWTVLLMTEKELSCVTLSSCVWLNLPSSLILPLLFLHKIRKNVCCRNNKH